MTFKTYNYCFFFTIKELSHKPRFSLICYLYKKVPKKASYSNSPAKVSKNSPFKGSKR